jgi:1-acyl-sn-glycerol-3-phosphate acyltransferase
MNASSPPNRPEACVEATGYVRDGSARVSRLVRIAATAVAFAVAGMLSLTIALAVVPVLRLLARDREASELRVQRAIHGFARLYVGSLRLFRIQRVESFGAEKLLEPGLVVVANHPTLADALVLMSLMPQADCVVKPSYYDNPFLRGAARAAGYVPVGDGRAVLAECVQRLRRGRSVLIFPEGTRSPVDGLGDFAPGAAYIALRAGSDVLPVTIECDPATLCRGQAWWDVPDRCPTWTVTVGKAVVVREGAHQPSSRARSARLLTASLHDHFERQLAVGR